jgi:hypothetical protein
MKMGSSNRIECWVMWKRKIYSEEKRGKKDGSLLEELCGGDSELYDVLKFLLYINPIAAITRTDLETLIKETEQSDKKLSFVMEVLEYRKVVDKALFEASQNPEERNWYGRIIKDLVSKIIGVTEKAKEKVEGNGLNDKGASLEKRIYYWRFISERIEDVLDVSSHYYNERLVLLGEKERREERSAARRGMEREEREEAEREEMRIGGREDAGRDRRRKERVISRSKESE